MNRVFRIAHLVCILPVLSLFLGCGGSDSPAAIEPPVEPPMLGGSVGVYADADGTQPHLFDTGGTVSFCVVHKVTDGATASAFKIEAPTGWTLLGAEAQFPVAIGNVNNGIAIGYGECLSGTIHVMTVTYASPGTTVPGVTFKVSPHAQWPENIRVVNCHDDQLENAVGEETPVTLWAPGADPRGEDKNKKMDRP